MITVHEFAHGVAGVALGLRPTVYPDQVATAVDGSTGQRLITALAGPVASLVIGVLVLLAAPVPRTFWGLLLFWFGTLNVQEFSGYLMTGPFVAIGDIGQALGLVSAPAVAYIAVFAAGLLGTLLLGRFATRRLLAMTDAEAAETSGQLRSLGLFAWLAGSAVVILASLLFSGFGTLFTSVGFFELLGTLTVGVFLAFVRFFMGREEVPGQGMVLSWPLAGLILLVVVVVADHLLLGPGLRL